jgi:hypothetical protein
LIDGVHKDPEKVHLPGAEPLHADALLKFRLASAPLLAQLTTRADAQRAAAGVAAAVATGAGAATAVAQAPAQTNRSAR